MRGALLERTARWCLAACFGIAVAAMAAQLTWRLTGYAPVGPVVAAGAPASGAARAEVDLAPIRRLAPFGTLAPEPEPEPEVKETSLGLTLRGVLIASAPEASSALIEDAERKVRGYRPGDAVGDATVVEVRRDHVVLSVDGRRETLSFPRPGAKADAGAAAIRAKLAGAGATPTRKAASPDEVIARYRRRIAENPQTVLDDLGVEVTPEGYRVGPSPSAGVRQAGLRPGDVVASVNGESVGDVENDRRLFDKIAASGRARLEIVRDGGKVTLSFPLR